MKPTTFKGLSARVISYLNSSNAVPAITTAQLNALVASSQLEALTQAQVNNLDPSVIRWLHNTKGYITLTSSSGTSSGIETSGVVTAPTASTITAGQKAVTITGSSGADNITGTLKADTISTGGISVVDATAPPAPAPADTINAGFGSDTIIINNASEAVLAAVTIDGGTYSNDNDVLILSALAATKESFVDIGFTNIKGIETLQLTGASSLGAIDATTGTTSVGLGARALAAGITKVITGTGDATGVVIVSDNPITVDASALTTAAVNGLTLAGAGAIKATVGASALKIDASAATGNLELTGNVATATITGGSGADLIISGGSADTLTGGAGVDTIVAGAGADKIIILTAPTGDIDTTAGAITDIVNGFKTAGADTLSGFGTSGLANVTAVTGVTAVAQTELITITAAATGNTIIITGATTSPLTVTLDATSAATTTTAAAAVVTAYNAAAGHVGTAASSAGVVTITATTAGTGFTAPFVTGTATATETHGVTNVGAVTAVTGVAGNYVENETSVSDLATLLTAADTALTSNIHYYFGVTGGNGYLVVDNDGNGYTDVIQLSGVTTLAATDIVA
jgi:hypothetical protein